MALSVRGIPDLQLQFFDRHAQPKVTNAFVCMPYRTICPFPLTPNESRASFRPSQKGDPMAYNPPGRRSILSRLIAG